VSRRVLLFVAYVAVSLLTRGLFLQVEILDMDESAHAVGSWTWMNGGLLYRDFINNKPPLLYIYYAFAQLVFGKGLFAVHLMTALLIVPLTAFAASAFFDHDRTGIYAGTLYLIYSASFLAHDMHSTNAEILMVLPGAYAIVLLRHRELTAIKWRLFVSGILFGLGFLLKYQIALGIIAVIIACIKIQNRKWPYLFLGFFVPSFITLWLFQRAGGLDHLFYWLVSNNLRYAANPISGWEAAGRAASYLLPFLLVTSPVWYFWLWRARTHASESDDYRRTLTTWLILISIPPLFIGFRFFPHYFIQLYFPLTLASTPSIVQSLRRRAIVGYFVGLLILCTAINAYLYYGGRQVYRETDPVYSRVTERLKADPCFKNGTLFVWGYAPAFYYDSQLRPASRFVVMGQARLTGYVSGNLESLDRAQNAGVPHHWDWLMSDLRQNNATYILDTAPAAIYRWNRFPLHEFPRLQNYIRKNYEVLDVVDDVVIYRRNQCSSE
jgi:4-amino-4-deoxy-L-arabinose transferase-like glycosyltransferase